MTMEATPTHLLRTSKLVHAALFIEKLHNLQHIISVMPEIFSSLCLWDSDCYIQADRPLLHHAILRNRGCSFVHALVSLLSPPHNGKLFDYINGNNLLRANILSVKIFGSAYCDRVGKLAASAAPHSRRSSRYEPVRKDAL
jgi:hypothetical protein